MLRRLAGGRQPDTRSDDRDGDADADADKQKREATERFGDVGGTDAVHLAQISHRPPCKLWRWWANILCRKRGEREGSCSHPGRVRLPWPPPPHAESPACLPGLGRASRCQSAISSGFSMRPGAPTTSCPCLPMP
jgi:hypothetical protein